MNRREVMPVLAGLTLAACATSRSPRPVGADLQRTIDGYVERGYSPGIVAAIADGDTPTFACSGVLGAGSETSVAPDSIFRIASLTKPLTALATLMLVDDGVLRLDESVERLLPELANRRVLKRLAGPVDDTVPAERSITVDDLLAFRCGWGALPVPPNTYPVQALVGDIPGFGPPDPATKLDNDAYMRRLADLPLFNQPGTAFGYTTGSNILGVLIARAAGKSLPELLHERNLEPLAMTDTGFYVPEEKLGRFTSSYRFENGQLYAYDTTAGAYFGKPPVFAAGDGGLVSTVADYFRFSRMLAHRGKLAGKRVASAKAVERMLVPSLTREQRATDTLILPKHYSWGYGLAVATEQDERGAPAGTYGWFGGLGTSWFVDPSSDTTAIVFTETVLDSPATPPVHDDVARIAFA